MKLLVSAAAAALFLSMPAFAQDAAPAASACGAIVAAPELPDGADADYEEMERANEAYNTWAAANRTVLECRRAEVEAARARHEALRVEFTDGVERATLARTNWEAEVTEFNERNPRNPRSRTR